jgi:hypothetical protein
MTTSRRERQQQDASTRADLDETILVWNGVVARTERSSSLAARPGHHARERLAVHRQHDVKLGGARSNGASARDDDDGRPRHGTRN